MSNMKLVGAALVAAAVVVGCNDKGKENPESTQPAESVKAAETAVTTDPNQPVLTVGETVLTRGALDADVALIIKAQGDRIQPDQLEYARRQIANNLVQNRMLEIVLAAKAKSVGITVDDKELKDHEAELIANLSTRPNAPKSLDEMAAQSPLGKERAIAEFKNGVLIDKLIKEEVLNKDAKDYTAEANAEIEKIKAENAKCVTDEAALAKIKGFKAELDKVADADKAAKFAELAKANSDCPSGARGGDLDFFQHGMMVKEFDEVAFAQKVGQISDPVKTQFGWHLILTTEKQAAVEAKDDKPAEPEKVRASHILVKVSAPRAIPSVDDVKKALKARNSRGEVQEYILKTLREAKPVLSDDFKQVLPQE